MVFSYSKHNPINRFGVDISRLKKGSVIKYQYTRYGGVNYEPPLVFFAEVVTERPFSYAPGNSWAIRVVNKVQDARLKKTHIMYKLPMAVDVEDITEIR